MKKPLILLIVLLIPAVIFLMRPNIYWNMHDDMQLIRQLSLEKCLQDGQIPCRWSPDLGYGYGYPLFNFYPPMPYIVGQIFRTFSLNYINTVKLTALVQIIAAGLAMYLLAHSLFGPLGGFLSALFYSYAPYHALNIYVRGAMNEAWAAVFFPLIFYFCRKLILESKTFDLILLSLSFSGLLLSHNPMALTFTPFLFIWATYFFFNDFKFFPFNFKNLYSFITNKKQIIFNLFYSGLLAILLSAFFTLPVLFETKYVQIETMFNNYYHWSVHFTSLYQLFISSFWGDGASVWGQQDNMSFMIGYLHWIIPIAILLFTAFKTLKDKRFNFSLYSLPILLILLGFFAAFMTHERSVLLWKIFSPIQKIQFPWRFLNHSLFFLSLSVGTIFSLIKIKSSKINKISLIVLSALVITLNLRYFTPITSGPITDEQKFSGKAWENQITSGIYDYLPKTAPTAPKAPAKPFIDFVTPGSVKYQISGEKKGTDWVFFNLDLASEADVGLPVLYFPDFVLTDYGKSVPIYPDSQLGRVTAHLSAGNHQLYLKLHNTPIRTISNYLSLFSWGFVILYFGSRIWLKKKSIK